MAKTKRPGLACLADGGRTPNLGATFGPRYGDKADGEGFDRARKNYERFPKATGSISERPETMRGALATILAGDQRMSPAKARFVEGLTGSTPAGGGMGIGLADLVPVLGAGLTVSDVAHSDAPAMDAAIGAGLQAAPFAGPLARAGKAAVTSRAGKAAAGAVAAGATMSPDDAEAGFGGFRKAIFDNGFDALSKLEKARTMELRGRSPLEIWRETGIEKGKDKKYRFEFPDDISIIGDPTVGAAQNKRFGDIFSAPSHFKHYPDLAEMRYEYDPGMNAGASYFPAGNGYGERIAMGPITDRNRDLIPGYMLHELQHAIQGREGFQQGSNPEYAFHQAVQDIKRLSSPEGRAMAQYMEDPEWEVARRQGMQQAMDGLTPEARALVGRGLYHRNAGEVEARNVQERMRYNDAARQTTPPSMTASVQRPHQIVPDGPASENLTAYERLLEDIADAGSPYADGGRVEADPLDELLALAGGLNG